MRFKYVFSITFTYSIYWLNGSMSAGCYICFIPIVWLYSQFSYVRHSEMRANCSNGFILHRLFCRLWQEMTAIWWRNVISKLICMKKILCYEILIPGDSRLYLIRLFDMPSSHTELYLIFLYRCWCTINSDEPYVDRNWSASEYIQRMWKSTRLISVNGEWNSKGKP